MGPVMKPVGSRAPRSIGGALVVGALVLAPEVSAADTSSTRLERFSLSSLPLAAKRENVSVPPTVKRIPAGASVPGLKAERGDATYFQVMGDARVRDAAGCLMRSATGAGIGQRAIQIFTQEGVVPVTVERLVEAGEGAFLRTEVVLFDSRTRGAEHLTTINTPLKRVGAGPGSSPAWVYRDEAYVHVLFHADTSSGTRWRDAAMPNGMTSSCEHTHLVLSAKEPNGPLASAAASGSKGQAEGPDKFKARTFNLTASLSQTSRDKEPVLSLGLSTWEKETIPAFASAALSNVME